MRRITLHLKLTDYLHKEWGKTAVVVV